ncbi:hypothetical protein [Stenotrophomonas maltophilia]|uniref:hypothetical protein n=1 Tax=Stenotrophomonas maltophilia TaxID=40324 RepID=UPI0015F2003C|nr:hypothetical protein [Stenotrophomonas maltophilia]QDY47391.1 hypothetical protein DUW70_01945 [Stenotrophomonas maltophilia]
MADDQQLEQMRRLTAADGWRAIVARALKDRAPHFGKAAFDTYWIEGGHRIREQVGDDHQLAAFLWLSLPRYEAKEGARLELYRGENADRLRLGQLGFAWTPDRATAEMFASGLNACGSGGVLLRAVVGAEVIAGPGVHSMYLGERQYTVDPTAGFPLERLAEFPPFV